MNALIVFGTRPEAIKLAPIYLEAMKHDFSYEVFCTQQQPKLAAGAWASFVDTKPIIGSHSPHAGSLMKSLNHYTHEISEIVSERNINFLIVQGDTLSALAGSMVAFFMKLPLAHIEAGLTSSTKIEPFPEETIRNIIDIQSDLLFAPTDKAFKRLAGRIQNGQKLLYSGNTIVDALRIIDSKHIGSKASLNTSDLSNFLDQNSKVITVTMHRRESFGLPAQNFIKILKEVIQVNSDTLFVFVRHSNPAMNFIDQELNDLPENRVFITNPLEYANMVQLLKQSSLLLTDSGGLQEEALVLGLETIVLRNFTERPEILDSGLGILLSPNDQDLFNKINVVVTNCGDKKLKKINLNTAYGNGNASSLIVSAISNFQK